MSVYLKSVYEIIDEFDDKCKSELCEHYFLTWSEKLRIMKPEEPLSITILADLNSIFNKYKFTDKERLCNLERLVFGQKIHELRGSILCTLDRDYSSDTEDIHGPERWVLATISNLNVYFGLSDPGHVELFKKFNDVFLEELCMIFISQNKKFGPSGNQLVLDLLFYKHFADGVTECNFRSFFERFIQNFREGSFKGMDALGEALKSYL